MLDLFVRRDAAGIRGFLATPDRCQNLDFFTNGLQGCRVRQSANRVDDQLFVSHGFAYVENSKLVNSLL